MSLQRAASRAGVDVDTYQQFLQAAEALTDQYRQYGQDRYGSGLLGEYTAALGDQTGGSGPLGEGEMFLGGADGALQGQANAEKGEVSLLQDQYNQEFLNLAEQFGVQTQVWDDDKLYWLSPGNPFEAFSFGSNPYGDEAQMGENAGLGMYTRDRRTDSPDFADFVREFIPNSPSEILQFALTAGLGAGADSAAGLLDLQDFTDAYYDADDAVNQFAPQEGGDIQAPGGNSTFEDVLDGIASILGAGGGDGISIPIPGLPIEIPGNMTFEGLMDIAVDVASSTGETIDSVLDKILGGLESAGEQVPGTGEPVTADPSPFPEPGAGNPDPGTPTNEDVEEDQGSTNYCTLGRPWGLEGYSWDEMCGGTHNSDGSPKGSTDDLNEEQSDPQVPGVTGDINDPNPDPQAPGVGGVNNDEMGDESDPQTPGFGALGGVLAGLVPFALRADRPERQSLTPGRQLMQANESRLSARPDYGTPTPAGLFDFGNRISQPTQVAQDPEARRETMSATERERLRRMRRQGLLG